MWLDFLWDQIKANSLLQVWENIGDKLVNALLSRESVNDSFEARYM